MNRYTNGKRSYEDDIENYNPSLVNARTPTYGLNKRARTALGRPFQQFNNNWTNQLQDYLAPSCPPGSSNTNPITWNNQSNDSEFDSPNFYNQVRRKPFAHQFPREEFQFADSEVPRNFSKQPTAIANTAVATSHTNFTRNVSLPKRRDGIRVLTGNVEKALAWSRLAVNQHILLEVIGFMDVVRNGIHPSEKIFRVKDSSSGPMLEVAFYEIDRKLAQIPSGTIVKVVGAMKTRFRLQAFSIVPSSERELLLMKHVSFICARITHEFNIQ